jgi:hypothetical protein
MTLPSGYLRGGSVSLRSARKAARAAKAETSGRSNGKVSPSVIERYLGHFGPSVRKSSAKKTSGRGLSFKKASVKKASARKAGVRKTVRSHVAKKTGTRKSAGSSKKR